MQVDSSSPLKREKLITKKANTYRGISQVYNQSKGHQQEFQDRFKGRATLINKEGHVGVVTNAQKPIEKAMQ
jgi:hypothetical protein